MAVVAGVDFGTLSVRVTLVDSQYGPDWNRVGFVSAASAARRSGLCDAVARRPDGRAGRGDEGCACATQDQRRQRAAIALDTTGSSVIPVGEGLEPLDEYYLWCDHRAHAEAEEITTKAHAMGLEAIEWCGGVYSHEWGFAKLLHWLRHNPGKRDRFVTALEHCDMVAATLSGVKNVQRPEAQRVRDGSQVDVESEVGRTAAGGVSGRGRSPARRCARQDGRRVSDQRQDCRASFGGVG